MEKFRYSITPVGIIKLESMGNIGIRSPRTLELTLDEVKTCLKKARVYRRFNGTLMKKVTLSNCERLHNAEYIPEEEYKDFKLQNKSKDKGTVKSPEEVIRDTVDVNNKDSKINKYIEKKTEEFKKDEPKIEKEIEELVKKEEEKIEEKQPEVEIKQESSNNNKPSINTKNNHHKKNK